MGLWMIQSVRHELKDAYSFGQLCQMAEETDFPSRVPVNDQAFLAPDQMIAAIQEVCPKLRTAGTGDCGRACGGHL